MVKLALRSLSITVSTLFLLLPGILRAQTVTTFEGIDASQVAHPDMDADANGAVGTKQYMEWTNVYYQAYDKTTFAPVWPTPQLTTTPFVNNGLTNCKNFNGGDGVISFDHLASRWIIAAHGAGPNYYYCIAVSNTDDLTSSNLKWFTYAFPLNAALGTNTQGVTYFPDWPKIGTWTDGYYVSFDLGDPSNFFQEVGILACVFDRNNMLIGAAANPPQCFGNPVPITGSLYLQHSLEPADVEGTTAPPTGNPEYFVSIQNPVNDGVTTTSNSLNLWQFHVDWSTPANSTFTQSTVTVPVFTPGCYSASSPGNTFCVPEPSSASTGFKVDSVGDRLMFRFAYRNFGEYQSWLISHTVQVGTAVRSQTGIRWYELRGNGIPVLDQSGTISPDQLLFRFMPSIAQDQNGNAAVGYNTSSASNHPGIRASWWNLNTQSAPTELLLYSGSGDEENDDLWGDYSSMTVDPVNDCTFWYVTEYYGANQTGSSTIWQTRISNFSAPTCGTAALAPTGLSFGNQAIGTTSSSKNVILTNGQSVALNISNISITGSNPNSFSQTNDCGSSVAPGGTCSINVSFAPTIAGSLTATLNVIDSASNSPQTVGLSGTGVVAVTLSNNNIVYGGVAINTSKTAAAVVMTNKMSVPLTGITILGSGAPFSQTNTCGSTLAVNAQCRISITFSPTVTGMQTGNVTITDSAPTSPQTIALKGTGVIPLTIAPLNLYFGLVTVGTQSAAKVITLTNNTNATLTFTSILINGTEHADFSQTNNCSSGLAAGAQCTVNVTFTPSVKGSRNATLVFTDSVAGSPQSVGLFGTGN